MIGKKEMERRYGAQVKLNRLLAIAKDIESVSVAAGLRTPGMLRRCCAASTEVEAAISALLESGSAKIFDQWSLRAGDRVLTIGGRWLTIVERRESTAIAVDHTGKRATVPYRGIVDVERRKDDEQGNGELFPKSVLEQKEAA